MSLKNQMSFVMFFPNVTVAQEKSPADKQPSFAFNALFKNSSFDTTLEAANTEVLAFLA